MSDTAVRDAERFIEEESQFHLGILPTEQSHPKTRNFSAVIAADTAMGAEQLLSVDFDLPPRAEAVLGSREFSALVDEIERAGKAGNRVCFSGCGATGRLAIILEKMWRVFWEKAAAEFPEKKGLYEKRGDASYSIMTGGDRALIRSVENFEDYQAFGARQLRDAGLGRGDLLVAITEGGETSSVIGTANEAADRGLSVFYVFNNPAEVLSAHIERSRLIIARPDVTTLDLATGPMALSGSTRLQATTMEMLIVGAALELACARLLRRENPGYSGPLSRTQPASRYAAQFRALVEDLSSGDALRGIAAMVDLEAETYRRGGRITYLCDDYLLDIISDTTERTPTFMIPPFRPAGDTVSPVSWAFVKDPSRQTREAWNHMLRRQPRGIEWSSADYREMGGSEKMTAAPPKLDREEIYAYSIGNEADPSRYEVSGSVLLAVSLGSERTDALTGYLLQEGGEYSLAETLSIAGKEESGGIRIPLSLPSTPMDLFAHLAVKMIFNTVSTATMGKLGRIRGNWMIQVDATNKKLIDRATRIVAQLADLPYRKACIELHRTMEEQLDGAERYRDSTVVRTLKRLGKYAEE